MPPCPTTTTTTTTTLAPPPACSATAHRHGLTSFHDGHDNCHGHTVPADPTCGTTYLERRGDSHIQRSAEACPSQPTIEWGSAPSSVREGGTITLRLVSDIPVEDNLTIPVGFFNSQADADDITPEASCSPAASWHAMTMTIVAGQNSVDCRVTTIRNDDDGDGAVDDGETFVERVGLFTVKPPGRTTGNGNDGASFTIQDNDPPPPVEVSISTPNSVTEDGWLRYTVSLDKASSSPVTFNWATTGTGTATVGSDYIARSDTETFAAGQTSRTITVRTLSDSVSPEPDETVFVELTSVTGATIGTATATGVIRDVPPVEVSIRALVPVGEGETLSYIVSLDTASSSPVTVDWLTNTAGSATAGSDYSPGSETLRFAVGETTKTVTVRTLTDMDSPEPAETVVVELSDANVANIGTATATGTILNVPPPPPPACVNTAALWLVGEGDTDTLSVSSSDKPTVVIRPGDTGVMTVSFGGSAGAWTVTLTAPEDPDNLSTRFAVWWGTDPATECRNGAIVDNDNIIGG